MTLLEEAIKIKKSSNKEEFGIWYNSLSVDEQEKFRTELSQALTFNDFAEYMRANLTPFLERFSEVMSKFTEVVDE